MTSKQLRRGMGLAFAAISGMVLAAPPAVSAEYTVVVLQSLTGPAAFIGSPVKDGMTQLEPGSRLVESSYVRPADQPIVVWLARATLALGAGLAAAVLAWLAVRRLRPQRRSSESLAWATIAMLVIASFAAVVAFGVLWSNVTDLIYG